MTIKANVKTYNPIIPKFCTNHPRDFQRINSEGAPWDILNFQGKHSNIRHLLDLAHTTNSRSKYDSIYIRK